MEVVESAQPALALPVLGTLESQVEVGLLLVNADRAVLLLHGHLAPRASLGARHRINRGQRRSS